MKTTWKHFPAGEHGFFRAPILVTGPREAVLIDGGFTLSDGRAVAEAIKATGKTLTTVYVSQSDPDYYFSLGPIKTAFPDAKIIAAPATVAAIRSTMQKKLEIWGPKLGANGPQSVADLSLPDASDARTLTVDGDTIEIVDAQGLTNRRYLWVPSLGAVLGGVLVFSGVHVWTADTQTPEQRAAWRATLDAIAARKPNGRRSGAHGADGGDRRVSGRVHPRLSPGVRGGAREGCRQRSARGRHDPALSRCRHGRGARHRRQSRNRRNEVGMTTMTANLDLIRSTYEGPSEENGKHLLAALAPDAEWTEAAGFPYAGTLRRTRSDHRQRVPAPRDRVDRIPRRGRQLHGGWRPGRRVRVLLRHVQGDRALDASVVRPPLHAQRRQDPSAWCNTSTATWSSKP